MKLTLECTYKMVSPVHLHPYPFLLTYNIHNCWYIR